jgi:protein phosphatase
MGTTATAAIVSKECATVAHFGDSRIYQFRGGKRVFRTTDHSFVFELVKAGTLTEEQARLSAQSNIILKALGVDCDVTPDVSVLPYLKGDRFALCTDGFWGVFSEEEFIRLLTKKGVLKEVLWDMTKDVNRIGIENGGGHDNYTVAVFDVLCESRIKPAMTKRLKVMFATVFLLLACSLFFNFRSVSKINQDKEKLKIANEVAVELFHVIDTTAASPVVKNFFESFAQPVEVPEETGNNDQPK